MLCKKPLEYSAKLTPDTASMTFCNKQMAAFE